MASDAEELAWSCLSRVLLSRCRAHPALGLLRPGAKTRKRARAIAGGHCVYPIPGGSLGRSGITHNFSTPHPVARSMPPADRNIASTALAHRSALLSHR
jgi:hypothetical protein